MTRSPASRAATTSNPTSATKNVPWWGLVSSATAPVLLIGGWTVAARLQPGEFDAVTGTISDLAALGASNRWLMTAALYGVGACHVVTAVSMRPAARPGRLVLAAGGLATAMVAALPLPTGGTGSPGHTVAAVAAFTCLAAWPAAAWRRRPAGTTARTGPRLLRRRAALGASTVLAGTVAWFFVEAVVEGPRIGLSERLAAGAQALWPLVVVATLTGRPAAR